MDDIFSEGLKEVDFNKYCSKCMYEKDKEEDPKSPCWDCLYEPVNTHSRKPVNFKSKE